MHVDKHGQESYLTYNRAMDSALLMGKEGKVGVCVRATGRVEGGRRINGVLDYRLLPWMTTIFVERTGWPKLRYRKQ